MTDSETVHSPLHQIQFEHSRLSTPNCAPSDPDSTDLGDTQNNSTAHSHSDFEPLPEGLYLEIFKWLDRCTLCRVSKTNSKWNRLASSNVLWKRLFIEDDMRNWTKIPYPFSSSLASLQNISQQAIKSSQSSTNSTPKCSPTTPKSHCCVDLLDALRSSSGDHLPFAYWKDLYKKSYLVEENWKKGNFHRRTSGFLKSFDSEGKSNSPVDLEIHPTRKGTIIVGYTHSGVIKIITSVNGIQCSSIRTWVAHQDRFHGLFLDPYFNENHLVTWRQRSESDDMGCCKIWDLDTGECLVNFNLGRGQPFCHPRYCNYRFSFWDREQRSIKVYDLRLGYLSLEILHDTLVMDIGCPFLVEAPDDKKINVWNMETNQIVHKLSVPREKVGWVTVSENRLIACHHFDLTIWDLVSGCQLNDIHLFEPSESQIDTSFTDEITTLILHKHLLIWITSCGSGHVMDLEKEKNLWKFHSDADSFAQHDTRLLSIKRSNFGHFLANLIEFDFL